MPNPIHATKSSLMRHIAGNPKLADRIFGATSAKPGSSANRQARGTFRALGRAAKIDGQGGPSLPSFGSLPVQQPVQNQSYANQSMASPVQLPAPAPQPNSSKATPQPVVPAPAPSVKVLQGFGSNDGSSDWLRFGTSQTANDLTKGITKVNPTETGLVGIAGGLAKSALGVAGNVAKNVLPAANIALNVATDLPADALSLIGKGIFGQRFSLTGQPLMSGTSSAISRALGSNFGNQGTQPAPAANVPNQLALQQATDPTTYVPSDPTTAAGVTGKGGITQAQVDLKAIDLVNKGMTVAAADAQVYEETGLHFTNPTGIKDGTSPQVDTNSVANAYHYSNQAARDLYDSADEATKARVKPFMDMVDGGASISAVTNYYMSSAARMSALTGVPESDIPKLNAGNQVKRTQDMADELENTMGMDVALRQLMDAKAEAKYLPGQLMDYVRAKDVSLKTINKQINSLVSEDWTKLNSQTMLNFKTGLLNSLYVTQGNVSKNYIDAINDGVTTYNNRVNSMIDEYNTKSTVYSARLKTLTDAMVNQDTYDEKQIAKYEKEIGDMYDILKYGTTEHDQQMQNLQNTVRNQSISALASLFNALKNSSATTKPGDLSKESSIWLDTQKSTVSGKTNEKSVLKTYSPKEVYDQATSLNYSDPLASVSHFAQEVARQSASDSTIFQKYADAVVKDVGGPEVAKSIENGTTDPSSQAAKFYKAATAPLKDAMTNSLKKTANLSPADVKRISDQLSKAKFFGGYVTEQEFVNEWKEKLGDSNASLLWRQADAERQAGRTPYANIASANDLYDAISALSIQDIFTGQQQPATATTPAPTTPTTQP